jgi:hypothetical protein
VRLLTTALCFCVFSCSTEAHADALAFLRDERDEAVPMSAPMASNAWGVAVPQPQAQASFRHEEVDPGLQFYPLPARAALPVQSSSVGTHYTSLQAPDAGFGSSPAPQSNAQSSLLSRLPSLLRAPEVEVQPLTTAQIAQREANNPELRQSLIIN